MSNLGEMVVKIVGDVTAFNKSIDDARRKFEDATSNFSRLGKNLTTFVTLPIIGLGVAAIKSAADMEMMGAEFTTLLGNGDKAKKMLADLTELAAKTPFQLTDLAAASKTMLAFGISSEKILPNIKMLGDIAGGNADKLKSLTLAFSQISSTGRLMGQDLLQLVNAGFNPLQEISKKTGQTMGELKKAMEKGAISADMVQAAFVAATSEGGLFFGGMERASKTFSGQMSTLIDDSMALARSFGEILLPTLKEMLGNVSNAVQTFTALDEGTKKNIIQFALLAAAIGPLILGITKLGQAFTFLSTNPWILGLTAIIATTLALAGAIKQAATEQENLSVAMAGTASIEIQRAALKSLADNLKALEGQRSILIARGVSTEGIDRQITETYEKQRKISLDLRDALRQLELQKKNTSEAGTGGAAPGTIPAPTVAGTGQTLLEWQKEQDAAWIELNKETDAENLALEEEALAKGAETYANAVDQHILLDQELTASTKAETEKRNAFITQSYEAVASVTKSVFSQLGEDLANNEVSWNSLGTAAINSIGGIVSALGDELAAKGAAKLVEAIAAALDPFLAWAAPGLFASAGVLSGGAAAAWLAGGALQAVKLAEGGIVQPQVGGVQATIAEAGMAEAVIPLDRLDRMLESGGSSGSMVNLTVQMDSKVLYSKIFDATKNRTVLISAGAMV